MWHRDIGPVDQDLYLIGNPQIPLYLLRTGSEWALFEGGLTAMGPLILQQLQEIVGDLARLTHWFINHAHYDHYGLLPYLAPKLPHTRALLSHDGLRALHSERARAVSARLNADMAPVWNFPLDHDAMHALFERNTLGTLELVALRDDETVTLADGRRVRCITTPGHSRCSASYLVEPDGLLFASDSLGEMSQPGSYLPLVFDDFAAYRSSLKKLGELSPARIGLGHHGIIGGDFARTAAHDALHDLERSLAQIDSAHQRGDDLAALTDRLTDANWPRTNQVITRDLFHKSMQRLIERTQHYINQP